MLGGESGETGKILVELPGALIRGEQ
jgi:hypothetical protein